MESSKTLSKIFNLVFPFSDFLYILQQEEYSTKRYWKWLPRFFWRRNFQARSRLKYTKRAITTLLVILIIWMASLALGLVVFHFQILPALIIVVLWLLLIPIFAPLVNALLNPAYALLKTLVIRKAAAKIKQQKNLRIMAIAGSFGKTTTKNFIYQLVRYNYMTQMIPGNINTTLGIAMWINNNLRPETELLVAEMDAYEAGEIARSCFIAPPDIAIITAIGDQHLERFGNKEKLAQALKEIFLRAKPDAKLLCRPETAPALNFRPNSRQEMINVDVNALSVLGNLKEFVLNRFSTSNRLNLSFAIKTAELLNVPRKFIVDTSQKLEIPERRQKITEFYGYECVDDSYNISFTTAQAGIDFAQELARRRKKKLLVVSAGIPELAPADRNKNEVLGRLLAGKADYVVVLKSIFANDIIRGIADSSRYAIFKNLKIFLNEANQKFPPSEWVLLLQPELTDLYY